MEKVFNYELLEETKKQIQNMCFFKTHIQDIISDKYEIIHDYKQAIDNAFNRCYQYGEFEECTWVDILENNMAKVKGIIYQHTNYAELSRMVRRIEIPELRDIKYSIDDEGIQEEIEAELILCAKSRFVCGKNNDFFEMLFEVYCMGGWPCGWGDGKIIVYIPQD